MVNVKPVTLYDVAEYAGVSYQTVSRVVNPGLPRFCENAGKVEAAMAELNYIPNRVAQQLAGKQSLLIGVATSSLALRAVANCCGDKISRRSTGCQRGGVDGRTKRRRSL